MDNLYWNEQSSTWLYGGDADSMHFNISSTSLDVCNLQFGLGREKFQALLDPMYVHASEVDFLPANEKCIVVFTSDQVYVYPYVQLTFHEVVNEVFEGRPAMVAYCVRADLAVVYSREICDTILHFGVSGFTYSDPNFFDGKDAFLLWDRESESLWWPFSDMGVSGLFNNTVLPKFADDIWTQLSWSEVLVNYPESKVLAIQSQSIPNANFKLPDSLFGCF